MKAKVKLTFERWKPNGEQTELVMATNDNEQSTGSKALTGTIEASVDKLYELIKAQNEQGRKAMFVLEVVD